MKNTVSSRDIQAKNDRLQCFIFYSLGWENVRFFFTSVHEPGSTQSPERGHTQVSRQHVCRLWKNIMVSPPVKKLCAHKGGGAKKAFVRRITQFKAILCIPPPPHLPARHRCRLIRKCCSRIFFSIYGPSPEKRALSTLWQKKLLCLCGAKQSTSFLLKSLFLFNHVSIFVCGEAFRP